MSIRIRYQNTRGLRTKKDEFSTNILNSTVDFHCITETWLKDDFFTSEYIDNSYISYRRDRDYNKTKTTRGGGCWIFHKAGIHSVRRYDLESDIDFVEDLWIQIKLSDSEDSLFICVVYITPKPSNASLYIALTDKIKDNLTKLNSTDRILIIGDFNLSDIKWNMSNEGMLVPTNSSNCEKANDLINMISFGGLHQYNSILNEKKDEILDLVLSSDPLRAINVTKSLDTLVDVDDYHPPLEINLSIKVK